MNRNLLAAYHSRIDIPLRFPVAPRRALEQLQTRGHSPAECRVGQRIGRIFKKEPRRVGPSARGIEGSLAHFIEPIGRRRIHRACPAHHRRSAAKFTDRHWPPPSPPCCSAAHCRLSNL